MKIRYLIYPVIFVLGYILINFILWFPERYIIPPIKSNIEKYFDIEMNFGRFSLSVFPLQIGFYDVVIYKGNEKVLYAEKIFARAKFSYTLKYLIIDSISFKRVELNGNLGLWKKVLNPVFSSKEKKSSSKKRRLRLVIKRIFLTEGKTVFKNEKIEKFSFFINLIPFTDIEFYSFDKHKIKSHISHFKIWNINFKGEKVPLNFIKGFSGIIKADIKYKGDFETKNNFSGYINTKNIKYDTGKGVFSFKGDLEFSNRKVVSKGFSFESPFGKSDIRFFFSGNNVIGTFDNLKPANNIFTGKLKGFFIFDPFNLKLKIRIKDGKGYIEKLSYLHKVLSALDVFTYLFLKFERLKQKGFPINKIKGEIDFEKGILSVKNILLDSDTAKIFLNGGVDAKKEKIDLDIAFQTLKYIPEIISKIPVLGKLIVGKNKQLLPIMIKVKGDLSSPGVTPKPIKTLTKPVKDTLKRIFNLPNKLIFW